MSELTGGWLRKPIAEGGEPAAEEGGTGPLSLTFIDAGASFEGTLRIAESIRIDGEFRGAIESEQTIIVAAGAGIEAHLRAREVVIRGAVVGNVVATRQLTLCAGARLHGDVETPCLEIQKHAFFNGRTQMARPEQVVREQADPVVVAAEADPA
jgi:cytoskeletal protein CcmA (bactofilin family)